MIYLEVIAVLRYFRPQEGHMESNSRANSVDFSELILGFSSAALYYLGQDIEGQGKAGKVNVDLARQNIDIILMLKEKTKGNLKPEEESLIQQILLDLQVKVVEATSQPTP
jgi:hypothetical protein